ncbi:ABC transporter [Bacillus cereus]|uniref:ABC transporter n=1 Tax=Bacillus cereus TaxID=1396 RepID=A0A2B0LPP5_BACCE|nr:ABC transporter [Bacillus cereus]
MIFIYTDFGGTHTTSLAAAYHLNKLPTDRILTKEEILNVEYFNKLKTSDMGKLIFRGRDAGGNPVYTIGHGTEKLVVPAMKNLAEILQQQYQNKEKIIFSNTSPTVPLPMTFGGLFSRRLHIDFIGVPLLVWGAKLCCDNIQRLVSYTKEAGRLTDDSVVILENETFK